jgi:hypothetical protein
MLLCVSSIQSIQPECCHRQYPSEDSPESGPEGQPSPVWGVVDATETGPMAGQRWKTFTVCAPPLPGTGDADPEQSNRRKSQCRDYDDQSPPRSGIPPLLHLSIFSWVTAYERSHGCPTRLGGHATQACTETARPGHRGHRFAFGSRSGVRRRPSSTRRSSHLRPSTECRARTTAIAIQPAAQALLGAVRQANRRSFGRIFGPLCRTPDPSLSGAGLRRMRLSFRASVLVATAPTALPAQACAGLGMPALTTRVRVAQRGAQPRQ